MQEPQTPLLQTPLRSDAEPSLSQAPAPAARSDSGEDMTVIVESLVPVRGYLIECKSNDTIRDLKSRYAEILLQQARALAAGRPAGPPPTPPSPAKGARRESARPNEIELEIRGGATQQDAAEYDLVVRLCRDGVELQDARTLREYAIGDGARIIAMETQVRRGLGWRAARQCVRWWPLLLCAWLFGVMAAEAVYSGFKDTAAGSGVCDRPLLAFIGLCGPILLPYGLVFSGAYQEDEGHRILWFVKNQLLTKVVLVAALVALVWFIVGGTWIFSGDSECRSEAPRLYYSSVVAWCLLLVLNLPWAVLLVLPFLILCRCPIAFTLISCMAGIHRPPQQT